MREPVLKAVAAPKKFLWAPFELGAANLALQLTMMIMCIGIFQMNPFMFLISIIGGHIFLVIYGAKEPHLGSLLKSYGRYHHRSVNIYSCKGTKLVS